MRDLKGYAGPCEAASFLIFVNRARHNVSLAQCKPCSRQRSHPAQNRCSKPKLQPSSSCEKWSECDLWQCLFYCYLFHIEVWASVLALPSHSHTSNELYVQLYIGLHVYIGLQSVLIADSLLWEESQQFKTDTFTMDGDDDLFAVFDADENAEANQSKPTPSGQVMH